MRAKFDASIVKQLLIIAWPLMLSMTGQLLLQLTDAVFLAWYSLDTTVAAGPAGMLVFFFGSLFSGMMGYSAALVAQCYGKGERTRIGSIVWQGLLLSLGCGLFLLALSPFVANIFAVMGHPCEILAMERQYFQIQCFGLPLVLATNVLCGFYAGRGDTRPVIFIQGTSIVSNILLDYLLIFGYFGFPRLGIVGAAYATVIAQFLALGVGLALVYRPKWRNEYGTWEMRYRWDDMMLYFRFGLASGVRMAVEVFAWTAFVLFVGRISPLASATTNIVFRLNWLTFFPLLGLGEAVRTLVGQAQGRRDSAYATRAVWHGFILAEGWMLLMSVFFLGAPRVLLSVFANSDAVESHIQFAEVSALGVVLLRYVVAYSVVDAANCTFAMGLQGAGDTRWTMHAMAVLSGLMFVALLVADQWFRGIHASWCIITFFTIVMALTWGWRFHRGKWRDIVVIE